MGRLVRAEDMAGLLITGRGRLAAALAALLLVLSAPAYAQEPEAGRDITLSRVIEALFNAFSREETAALSLVLGVIAFAAVVAIMLVRTRDRLRALQRESAETLGDLKIRAERAESLLAADQQVLVVWDPNGGGTDIQYDPGTSEDLPSRRADVLAFGKWLAPESAGELDGLVERLRGRGETFNVMLRTRAGGHVEADGRTAGGRAVLRLRDLAGQRRELAEIHDRHKRLRRDVERMRALLETAPMPAWLRDAGGRLTWANPAYAEAVGSADAEAAVVAGTDLVEPARPAPHSAGDGTVRRRIHGRFAGGQRVFEVFEAPAREGSAGVAVDVTELEDGRNELARREAAHARTLDKVTTGVAVFGPDRRLSFHNSAFRDLWPLDAAFLAAGPGHGEILDRLRTQGRLPEQADYRAWRARQVDAAAPPDGREHDPEAATRQELWHLPDGQILRVVHSALPDGGLACLYEDVTATLDLESRFVALTRVQRETLESLDEGIAVFASDGRLKLHNPTFARMWRLAPTVLENEPHVEEVVAWCRALHVDDTVWDTFRTAIAGLADSREAVGARLERPDGSIVDLRTLPLPDGATLAVFTDVTDSARIEKALRDRNEALLAAERIKNEFVHKVSYELRSPLTNIIGFAELISDDATGPLNDKQRDYVDHILGSSGALLAIINDILDLATLDAGVMELDVSEVEIAAAVSAASDAIADRVAEQEVGLEIDVPEDIGSFVADEKRIRQVLFNLLSNAVGFSSAGQTVTLTCRRTDEGVAFAVSDQGPGIPEPVRRSVFERFESYALGTRHRGVGLGLSIVKSFVELHGGEVRLESEPGRGTTLTCVFPPRPRLRSQEGETAGPAANVTPLSPRPSGPAPEDRPASERRGGSEAS